MTGSGIAVSRAIVQRAEALLRALIGVSQAEVHFRTTGGVERVRLVADGGLSNGQIVQNVRSALLAALGVALQPGQIEFVEPGAWVPESSAPETASAAAEEADAPAGSSSGSGRSPSDPPAGVVRNGKAGRVPGNGANGTASVPQSGNGGGNGRVSAGRPTPANGSARSRPNGNGTSLPKVNGQGLRPAEPAGLAGARSGNGAHGEVVIGTRSVQLEAVEIVRQAGRIRCRVVLASGPDRYAAVADCAEQPLSELQLAARVTCDALRAADLTQARFEALTVANLAGGMHVVVALGGWSRGAPVRHSGSAVIRESAEYAAALAVLQALANT